MKISELRANSKKVDIEGTVTELSEVKEGKGFTYANGVLQDDTGSVALTLWNREVSEVSVGDRIRITNGYIKVFNDTLQLSAGKFGKLTVIDAVKRDAKPSQMLEQNKLDALEHHCKVILQIVNDMRKEQ